MPEPAAPNRLHVVLRAAAERAVAAVAAFNRRRLPKTANPYLVGIHAPLREEFTLDDLRVSGTIPPALNGRYLKMGANPVRPEAAGHHWFLGDGMLHAFTLGGGRSPSYRNRWINSRLAAAALDRPAAPGPRRGRNDTVNTNVHAFGTRVFALVEAGSTPVEISPDGETQRYQPFDDTLRGAYTGHPHRDPLSGEHHAVCYDADAWNAVRHVVVSDAGRVTRDVSVPVRHGPCVHDCGFTARFVVVLDLPVTFSMRAVLAGHAFPFRWNPAHPARLGLLPRHGTAADITWCPLDPCFVFHVANAFDAPDGTVVLDVVCYPTMFAGPTGELDALGVLERWTVDPAARRVDRRVLDLTPQEFPRIDDRRAGREHRFLFGTAVPPDADPQLRGASRVFRHDRRTGGRTHHDFGPDNVPGEFTFVPRTQDAPEGDGWLLGLVIDRAADTTDLAILDATDVAAPPVARIHLPHRVPPGFHGNWFPAG